MCLGNCFGILGQPTVLVQTSVP